MAKCRACGRSYVHSLTCPRRTDTHTTVTDTDVSGDSGSSSGSCDSGSSSGGGCE